MGLVLLLIVLAIAFGVVGLIVSALKWLLIIALVLFVVGVIRGAAARSGP
jgi:hypothetical protein